MGVGVWVLYLCSCTCELLAAIWLTAPQTGHTQPADEAGNMTVTDPSAHSPGQTSENSTSGQTQNGQCACNKGHKHQTIQYIICTAI